MVPLLKKLKRSLLSEKRFKKYFVYAIGEIILLVVGILIALQINNYNHSKILEKEAVVAYQNVQQQVSDDRQALIKAKDYNSYYAKSYKYGNSIISKKEYAKIDSLALITMTLSRYSDFHTGSNIYETLVNSGDLKLMKNKEITSTIQKLETTYIFINNLENIHWELIINELSPELKGVINYATVETVRPEKLYSVELQNIYIEIIELTKIKDIIYTQALNEIERINELIDNEIGENNHNTSKNV